VTLQYRIIQAGKAPPLTIRPNPIEMDAFVTRHAWALAWMNSSSGATFASNSWQTCRTIWPKNSSTSGAFRLPRTLEQTICGTNWQLIDANFDPRTQDSPNTDKLGAGDEVLPAWSTHLVTLPSDNRKTVAGILHHSFILSSGEVQDALGGLLGLASPAQRVNNELNDELSGNGIASEADAEKFVLALNDFFQNPKKSFPQVVGRLKEAPESSWMG